MKFNKNIFILFLLVMFVSLFFLFSGINIKNTVLALTGNYNKNIGDTLGVSDWNNLDNDFVDKGGDVMQGELNMNGMSITNLANPVNSGDAINKSALDAAIASVSGGGSANITDSSGNNLKMVCGQTTYGDTPWQNSIGSITLVVDTSSANFSNDNVTYFVSLYGDSAMYKAVGYTGIYFPTASSFRVYVAHNDVNSSFNPTTAKDSYKWYIKWCGVGQ